MRSIADHIYDISNNSITAKSSLVKLFFKIDTNKKEFLFKITDNGKGISEENLKNIFDPFYTSRDKRIRKVGLGLPMIKQNAELTGGYAKIKSEVGVGTELEVLLKIDNIDIPELGEFPSTFVGLITADLKVSWEIEIYCDEEGDSITTDEIKEALGDDIPLDNIKVRPILKNIFIEMLDELEFEKRYYNQI